MAGPAQLLHARNPHDWVGVAHNRAIDEFRRRLRAPGVLTRSACSYIADFVAEPERVPAQYRSKGRNVRRVGDAVLRQSPLCRPKATTQATPTLYGTARQGAVAYAMLGQIEAAVDAAANSDDLAVRLTPVLDGAAGLQEVERDAVLATVSVTQSSFEYWAANLGAFTSEVQSEYEACARQFPDASIDDARDQCTIDGTFWESRQRGMPSSAPVRFATFTRLPCDPSLDVAMRRIGRADARGAFGGAWAGAFGGPEGALLGGLIGGAGGSIASGLESAWDLFWCIMR